MEGLEQELKDLAVKLEGKSKVEVKAAIDAFETKNKEVIDLAIKAVQDEMQVKLDAIQSHADKLDIKLQAKNKKEMNEGSDSISVAIKENAENIKAVKKGAAVEIKAVGNMTTANASGQPKQYNFDVVAFPSQKVNVEDLVSSISISGGTYTFTREGSGEGSIAAQTEGSAKSQRDYDFTDVDITTDFIAGFARYSKKMKNNLPYLESHLPMALRRDYYKAENSAFYTVLAAGATASTQVITGKNKAEMLMNEVARLQGGDYEPNAIVVTTADYYSILQIEKSTGAGYGLPFGFTYEGGQLRCLGLPVVKANWLATNKYFVGDWSRVNKVVTEGLSLEFSESDGDNFTKNNITARIESQVALAVEQPAALILGDFTAA